MEQRYNLPVIGYISNKIIRYNSIIEASKQTGISYHLIFEAAIGKIKSAQHTYWEYEDKAEGLKFKNFYIHQQTNYFKRVPFSYGPPCG